MPPTQIFRVMGGAEANARTRPFVTSVTTIVPVRWLPLIPTAREGCGKLLLNECLQPSINAGHEVVASNGRFVPQGVCHLP